MRVAVIGSRGLSVPDLAQCLPPETTAIVSGGARGVDTSARQYAQQNGLELIEFLPDYRRYGRGAPLRRNDAVVEAADYVVTFWDGFSHGTTYVIKRCIALGKPYEIHICTK